MLELSSYQIDLTLQPRLRRRGLLNVTPDHLDRYDSFEAYAASKARLFEMQSRPDHARSSPKTTLNTRAIASRPGEKGVL